MNKSLPFPQQLKHQRKLKGWSQADLAEKVDSDPQTVRRWENGKTIPRPYHQQKLFEIFGMDAEAFGLIDANTKHESETETIQAPGEEEERSWDETPDTAHSSRPGQPKEAPHRDR